MLNWLYLYLSVSRKQNISSIPLFGGLFLALGFYCLTKSIYSFFAIFADYGTIICFCAIPYLAKDAWQTSRFRIEHKFTAESKIARFTLKLFKGGVFFMKIDFAPPQTCGEEVKIISDNMQGKWEQNDNSFQLIDYREDRKVILRVIDDSTYLSKELNYPEDKQYKYDTLDNIEFKIS